jgi:hypothetical protein
MNFFVNVNSVIAPGFAAIHIISIFISTLSNEPVMILLHLDEARLFGMLRPAWIKGPAAWNNPPAAQRLKT